MTDRPIIFSAPMVKALLEGRKTQTRRFLKNTDGRVPYVADGMVLWDDADGHVYCWERTAAVGDRLWVREAHWFTDDGDSVPVGGNEEASEDERKHPSIHMPRWASRLTLIVTDVRVQRLQDISEDDARAEGADFRTAQGAKLLPGLTPKVQFELLWEDIYGPDAWVANPWVCALTFTAHKCNIHQMEAGE